MTQDYTDEYKEWLTQAKARRVVIETIEINHATTPPMRFANWDININRELETGDLVTFDRSRFQLTPTELSDSTDQNTSIVVSAFEPRLYDLVRNMTVEEREQPLTITPRLFYDSQSTINTPLINPPPVWNLYNVQFDFQAVRADLRAAPMRVQRIGTYFTALEWPVFGITY